MISHTKLTNQMIWNWVINAVNKHVQLLLVDIISLLAINLFGKTLHGYVLNI